MCAKSVSLADKSATRTSAASAALQHSGERVTEPVSPQPCAAVDTCPVPRISRSCFEAQQYGRSVAFCRCLTFSFQVVSRTRQTLAAHVMLHFFGKSRAKSRRFGRPRKAVDAARIASLRSRGLSWRAMGRGLGPGVNFTDNKCWSRGKRDAPVVDNRPLRDATAPVASSRSKAL